MLLRDNEWPNHIFQWQHTSCIQGPVPSEVQSLLAGLVRWSDKLMSASTKLTLHHRTTHFLCRMWRECWEKGSPITCWLASRPLGLSQPDDKPLCNRCKQQRATKLMQQLLQIIINSLCSLCSHLFVCIESIAAHVGKREGSHFACCCWSDRACVSMTSSQVTVRLHESVPLPSYPRLLLFL